MNPVRSTASSIQPEGQATGRDGAMPATKLQSLATLRRRKKWWRKIKVLLDVLMLCARIYIYAFRHPF